VGDTGVMAGVTPVASTIPLLRTRVALTNQKTMHQETPSRTARVSQRLSLRLSTMRVKQTLKIAVAGAALGGLVAGVVAFRTHVKYVSSSVVRLHTPNPPPNPSAAALQVVDFLYSAFRDQDSLGNIVRREKLYEYHDGQLHSLNGRIHQMRLAMQIGPAKQSPLDGSFMFNFSDEDPARAQRILYELIDQMAKTALNTPGTSLETLDSPTHPLTPTSPSWLSVTGAGIGIGMVAAVITSIVMNLFVTLAARSSVATQKP
jgi:hypothetical protein